MKKVLMLPMEIVFPDKFSATVEKVGEQLQLYYVEEFPGLTDEEFSLNTQGLTRLLGQSVGGNSCTVESSIEPTTRKLTAIIKGPKKSVLEFLLSEILFQYADSAEEIVEIANFCRVFFPSYDFNGLQQQVPKKAVPPE